MKKVLLITFAILMIGCAADEIPTEQVVKKCDCQKQTWVKQYNNQTISTAVFNWNGYQEKYSEDCKDDGKKVGGYSGITLGTTTIVEFRVVCK